ncbi:serine hydrolase [Asanoa ishikariensis]|uniref:CubicO group peptidase, beta-lactamase class C family n=1 Tax=Asanoa ishikariensis TaxID=137265 RepID=A0A1H3U098_9ACTN|nr:serine hydrolase domain-containing protein [Asanoa ishikariensis]GIF67736.1 serine hydrolase [Asanoa ishikariensis]SDZ55471.1 CubicO group peptidase, beta-lactamase class C family [Asanoa ishikariensis]
MTTLLPETARSVDAAVARAQATGQVPSISLGVVRDGELVHVATAGGAASPQDARPGPDTRYRIGSISKTMTATLVLQLRDEGRLALDDLLYRHLPGTPVGGVTLRQLLGHAAGLQREPEGKWWERHEGDDIDALLAGLTPDKVAFPPHRTYHYSNLAYGLLGAVLRRVTGEDWTTLLTKRLFDPLGMRATTYDAVEPFARGYVVHPWSSTLREEPRTDTGAMAPAGQLWSTVADLAHWAAFLAAPRPEVLAADTLAEMCAPVIISDLEAWTSGHGLGLELYRVGERVYVGHGGSMPGYVACLAVHRRSRTGVVGFANAYSFRQGSIGALGREVLTDVLDREPELPAPWRPAGAPPPPLAPLTGRWWWMGIEHDLAWDEPAGELVLSQLRAGAPKATRFTPEGTDRWRGRGGPNDGEVLTVRRDEHGVPVALEIATFIYTRHPDRLGP